MFKIHIKSYCLDPELDLDLLRAEFAGLGDRWGDGELDFDFDLDLDLEVRECVSSADFGLSVEKKNE